MFRPCMSGGNIALPNCSFDLQPEPTPAAQGATAQEKAAAYDQLRSAYDQLSFVADHMWKVYRTGFLNPWATSGDYPYTGYPFTGMGWTYDWSPNSATHVGVSEFIVRKGTPVTVEPGLEPAVFCGKKD